MRFFYTYIHDINLRSNQKSKLYYTKDELSTYMIEHKQQQLS